MPQGARHDEVQCPMCPKQISERNLIQHIELKHSEAGQQLSKDYATMSRPQKTSWWRKQLGQLG